MANGICARQTCHDMGGSGGSGGNGEYGDGDMAMAVAL
jgi:hypothetical protein